MNHITARTRGVSFYESRPELGFTSYGACARGCFMLFGRRVHRNKRCQSSAADVYLFCRGQCNFMNNNATNPSGRTRRRGTMKKNEIRFFTRRLLLYIAAHT